MAEVLKYGGAAAEAARAKLSTPLTQVPVVAAAGKRVQLEPVPSEKNPYTESTCPPEITDYLLPGGEMFGLFSDPFARMQFFEPERGNRNGAYWLAEKMETNDFTDRELRLLAFLSKRRCATRSQLQRVVMPESHGNSKVLHTLVNNLLNRGAICKMAWETPLKDGLTKPFFYGLTRHGAQAAQLVFQEQLERDFVFYPNRLPAGKGPAMKGYFLDLVANELYAELVRIDRVVRWDRRANISGIFTVQAQFEVIKDREEIRKFWLETLRTGPDWGNVFLKRLKGVSKAYESLPVYNRPTRVIVVVDGDSRIPQLAPLIAEHVPNVPFLFTTDERLLGGLGADTFLQLNAETGALQQVRIPFLQEGYTGMPASVYLEQEQNASLHEQLFED